MKNDLLFCNKQETKLLIWIDDIMSKEYVIFKCNFNGSLYGKSRCERCLMLMKIVE